jgi:predicted hydrocarbon binding protein
MASIQTRPSELALPVRTLKALREALAAEVGEDSAARALRIAGAAAGEAMFRTFASTLDVTGEEHDIRAGLTAVPEERFWGAVSAFFAARGWGRLSFVAVHEGVGALEAPDWIEANTENGSARPACFFTTGLLAGLLGRVTGEEVAVLEVECRSRGDARCRFLFGAPAALEALYANIATGQDVDSSLAALA